MNTLTVSTGKKKVFKTDKVARRLSLRGESGPRFETCAQENICRQIMLMLGKATVLG